MVCAECMKMCCLGGKNSVVKGLNTRAIADTLMITTRRTNNGNKTESAITSCEDACCSCSWKLEAMNSVTKIRL